MFLCPGQLMLVSVAVMNVSAKTAEAPKAAAPAQKAAAKPAAAGQSNENNNKDGKKTLTGAFGVNLPCWWLGNCESNGSKSSTFFVFSPTIIVLIVCRL